jgi:leader peptidase (prepilin peptidase) / N-methyltransferase
MAADGAIGSSIVSLAPGFVAAAVAVAAAPYLAALSIRVPDRDVAAWWRWQATTADRIICTTLIGAISGVLAGIAIGWTAAWPAFVALTLVVTPLIVIDVEHHRLPDRLVLTGAAAGTVLLTVAAAVRGDWAALLHAAEAGAASFAVFFALALISPSSVGFGDVKLAGLLGGYLGWLGWGYLLPGFFLGFVVGGLVAGFALLTRRAAWRTQLPFGPSLIAGALIAGAVHTGF